MPTQSMIRDLVDNAMDDCGVYIGDSDRNDHDADSWRLDVIAVLKSIHQACDVGLDKSCTYRQADGVSPLFPNAELFDEWDAYRFSQALLHYLDKEFSVDIAN